MIMLRMLKSIYYRLPFQDSQVLYTLRRVLYQRLMKHFMTFRYGKIVQKEIHGINYELDLSEAIETSLYYSEVYELDTLKCLQQAIHKDMMVFEIGANIGSHSFEIAKILQDGSGQLYCFEPTMYAFKKLIRNSELNHFTNIIFEQIALSDQEGTQYLKPASSLDTMAFAASWDIRNGRSKNHPEQKMCFKTLDHYVQEQKIERVDFLKIDVDGYELKVINGGLQTISTYHPIIIIELSECMLHYVGDSLQALLARLQNVGYGFQPVYASKTMNRDQIIQEVKKRQSFDCVCLYQP